MKAFESIAEHAIRAAENVPCSLEEFVAGLQDIVDALNDRIGVSVEELRMHESDDGS